MCGFSSSLVGRIQTDRHGPRTLVGKVWEMVFIKLFSGIFYVCSGETHANLHCPSNSGAEDLAPGVLTFNRLIDIMSHTQTLSSSPHKERSTKKEICLKLTQMFSSFHGNRSTANIYIYIQTTIYNSTHTYINIS